MKTFAKYVLGALMVAGAATATTVATTTAAEARVARSLTMGQTVDEIASQKGVSSHTVRSQVRGVLE